MKKSGKKKRAGKRPARPMAVREAATALVAAEDTARLFWNGRSQAVRLPKAFRFDGDAVRIRRDGDRVILEPLKPSTWPAGFFERIAGADESFERAVLEFRRGFRLNIPTFDAPEPPA